MDMPACFDLNIFIPDPTIAPACIFGDPLMHSPPLMFLYSYANSLALSFLVQGT